MNLAEVRIDRAGSAESLRALRAVGVAWPSAWIEHLASGPDGAALVASRDGDTLGVALGYRREDAWTLGHLAVREGLRGEGLGGALLSAAIAPFETCARTAIVPVAALDALSLVARRAMVPHGALLEITGSIPGERELAEIAAGQYRFEATPILAENGAAPGAVDALDRETRGVARQAEHLWYAQRAAGVLFALAGEVVGYVYAWPDGTIGPLAAASPAYLPQMLAFGLHAAASAYRASWVRLLVPGACGRALRLLLRVGLRIGGAWWWCAESPPPNLSCYVAYRPEAP